MELALFCSFLLGLGDSCFNTQLLSIVGFIFREDSAPAFAVFKFVQVKPTSSLFVITAGVFKESVNKCSLLTAVTTKLRHGQGWI